MRHSFRTLLPAFLLSLALPQSTLAQHNLTQADIERLMKELSNWGRWGAKDQMGTVNLITPAKRKQAAALVREGYSVSLRTMWKKWPDRTTHPRSSTR